MERRGEATSPLETRQFHEEFQMLGIELEDLGFPCKDPALLWSDLFCAHISPSWYWDFHSVPS